MGASEVVDSAGKGEGNFWKAKCVTGACGSTSEVGPGGGEPFSPEKGKPHERLSRPRQQKLLWLRRWAGTTGARAEAAGGKIMRTEAAVRGR